MTDLEMRNHAIHLRKVAADAAEEYEQEFGEVVKTAAIIDGLLDRLEELRKAYQAHVDAEARLAWSHASVDSAQYAELSLACDQAHDQIKKLLGIVNG